MLSITLKLTSLKLESEPKERHQEHEQQGVKLFHERRLKAARIKSRAALSSLYSDATVKERTATTSLCRWI